MVVVDNLTSPWKKLYSTASDLRNPYSSPPIMVAIDLLVPGMKARHCQTPMKQILQMVAKNDIRLSLPKIRHAFQSKMCIPALQGGI
jgi:hypothetical protein